MIIGIDFDNTIACYEHLIGQVAVELGFIKEAEACSKTAVRDMIRKLPDGDLKWQMVQAEVYGVRIQEAILNPGFKDFVGCARKANVALKIISHKTQYSPFAEKRIDLRKAAISWMTTHKFFDEDQMQFSHGDIFFAPSRAEKISVILEQQCTHFIDDLVEVFQEEDFPGSVEKILYNSKKINLKDTEIHSCADWAEVIKYFKFESNLV